MRKALALALLAGIWWAAPASAETAACGGRLREVEGRSMIYASKAEATCPWAFTVDEVVLGCEGGKDDALPILMTEDGTLYGFSSLAASRLKLPGIRDIWAADPKLPDQKVGIGPWLDAARSMCR